MILAGQLNNQKDYWDLAHRTFSLLQIQNDVEVFIFTFGDVSERLRNNNFSYIDSEDFFDKVKRTLNICDEELKEFLKFTAEYDKTNHWSNIAMMKLLMPFYFEDQFWFVDADIELSGEVNLKLQTQSSLLAVKEVGLVREPDGEIKEHAVDIVFSTTFSKYAKYFNTGVLFFNKNHHHPDKAYYKYMRKMFTDKEFYKKLRNNILITDQGLLNYFYSMQERKQSDDFAVELLPLAYNYPAAVTSKSCNFLYFPSQYPKDCLKHYKGQVKPWSKPTDRVTAVVRAGNDTLLYAVLDRIQDFGEVIVGDNFKDEEKSKRLLEYTKGKSNFKVIKWDKDIYRFGDQDSLLQENYERTQANFLNTLYREATRNFIIKVDDDIYLSDAFLQDTLPKALKWSAENARKRIVRLFYAESLEFSEEETTLMYQHLEQGKHINPQVLGGHYDDQCITPTILFSEDYYAKTAWVMPGLNKEDYPSRSEFFKRWDQRMIAERYMYEDDVAFLNVFAGYHLKFTKPKKEWFQFTTSTSIKPSSHDWYYALNFAALKQKSRKEGCIVRSEEDIPSEWQTYPRFGTLDGCLVTNLPEVYLRDDEL